MAGYIVISNITKKDLVNNPKINVSKIKVNYQNPRPKENYEDQYSQSVIKA